MLKHYLTIAWRSLLKSRSTSLINISGLVIGIMGALFIGIFVLNELEYDQHFKFKDRIYRLTSTFINQGAVVHSAQTTVNAVPNLLQYPEVECATRLLPMDEGFIFLNEVAWKENILFTDSSFTKIFHPEILLGDKYNCLTRPSSVIISREVAIKLFGEDWIEKKVLGEALHIDGKIPLYITAVFDDLPDHTHFNSKLFASIPSGFENWLADESAVYTYVMLKDNSDPESLTKKLNSNLLPSNKKKQQLVQVNLQRLTQIHLFSSFENDNATLGSFKNIIALILVAIFLLTIALTNFANLYTANSLSRLKEVGVRKAIGASSFQLRNQFLTETFLITIFATAIALLLIIVFLPAFNEVTESNQTLNNLMQWKVLLLITGLALVAALLVGMYPSIYLSGTKAIEALKGLRNKTSDTIDWRKGLIIIQFTISSIVIAVSIVAYRQVNLINNKPLGFDKENTVALANPYMLGSTEKVVDLKNELLSIRGVENVSITGYTPSQNRWNNLRITFPNRDPNSVHSQPANWLAVDEGFVQTMGISLKEGRNFLDDHNLDKHAVIINEKAAEQFKLTGKGNSAIGTELSFQNESNILENFQVIGIVRDFNFGSLHETIKPIIMKVGYHRYEMTLRLSPAYSKTETLRLIESVWKKNLPQIPFEYHFIKDRFDSLHKSDTNTSKLFLILCIVTVSLSVIGLFSVVTFTVAKRTKEIGIRKLLGASRRSIVFLLSNQFLKLAVIALIIALPIASILSNRWLDDFAFKTEVSWWIYTVAGFALLFVTALTLSYQTLKASSANPVDNLKYE